MSTLASILPFTAAFPTQTSPLRAADAPGASAQSVATAAALEAISTGKAPAPAATAPTTATPTTAATPAAPAAAATVGPQDESKGVLGLIHTSLTGLSDFLKNLPSRKTLLGE